jgi:Sigma-70, region 4
VRALAILGERERTVIVLRYGLYESEQKTLDEIRRRLGVSRERVRQLETEALERPCAGARDGVARRLARRESSDSLRGAERPQRVLPPKPPLGSSPYGSAVVDPGSPMPAEVEPERGDRSSCGSGTCPSRGDEVLRLHVPQTGSLGAAALRYRSTRRLPRPIRVCLAPRSSRPRRSGFWLNGAAPESNRPSRGLHDRNGFEDRLGHRAPAAPPASLVVREGARGGGSLAFG